MILYPHPQPQQLNHNGKQPLQRRRMMTIESVIVRNILVPVLITFLIGWVANTTGSSSCCCCCSTTTTGMTTVSIPALLVVSAFHPIHLRHLQQPHQLQQQRKQQGRRKSLFHPVHYRNDNNNNNPPVAAVTQSSPSSSSHIFPAILSLRGGGGSSSSSSSSTSHRRHTATKTTITKSSSSDNTNPSSSSSSSSSSSLLQRLRSSLPLREMIAEMTGTFLIVQMGTASIMSSIYLNGLSGGLYPIAMIWSIAITIAIACTGSISGAHLNPAITLALAIFRRTTFHTTKIIPYIVSQFIGAMLASCMNLLLFYHHIVQFEMTNNIIRSSHNAIPSAKAFGEYFIGISTFQAFMVELFGTFLLSFVIFSLTHPSHTNDDDKNNAAARSAFIPPLIGSTVAVLICTLAPLTQAGFNPARDFGPRIVAYFAGWKSVAFFPYRTSWIVYILGPILGAILGAAYTDLVLYRPNAGNDKI